MFDKKAKEFFEEHPNMTMLNLAWALYWRLAIVFLGIIALLDLIRSL